MKTTKTLILAIATIITITTTSCSFFEGTAKHREKGTPIESSEAAVKAILADREGNKGKRFAITGYLNYSAAGLTVYTNRPQTVYVKSEPGGNGELITPVEMSWGKDDNNSVYVPENAGGDDDKTIFYDNEAKPLTRNDKVMVSFEVGETGVYPVKTRIDKIQ